VEVFDEKAMDPTVPPKIFHISLNDPSKPTILLLHGIFCSHLEFAYVTPYLKDYNVLLVDLPGHSRSSAIPLTIGGTIDVLAKVIEERVPTGKAHIVGVSFGGIVALELARKHPMRVMSVFTSGATPFRGGQKWLAQHPRILYAMIAMIFKWSPDWVYWWLCRQMGMVRHEELRVEMKENMTLSLLRTGYSECLGFGMEGVGNIEAVRVAVVAGGKQDDVETVTNMGRLMEKNCAESRAFVVKEAIHGWDLQFPELFAQGVMAWIEEKEMPLEFEALQ
jgi:pimeloyl-ACP methyl ester carboxylesterase